MLVGAGAGDGGFLSVGAGRPSGSVRSGLGGLACALLLILKTVKVRGKTNPRLLSLELGRQRQSMASWGSVSKPGPGLAVLSGRALLAPRPWPHRAPDLKFETSCLPREPCRPPASRLPSPAQQKATDRCPLLSRRPPGGQHAGRPGGAGIPARWAPLCQPSPAQPSGPCTRLRAHFNSCLPRLHLLQSSSSAPALS